MKKAIIIFMLILLASFAYAVSDNETCAEQVKVYVFYGQGCPHCERLMRFIENKCSADSNIEIITYETYFNKENRDLFSKFASAFNSEIEGVPTTFIGDKVIVGEDTDSVFEEIKKCSAGGCADAMDKVKLLDEGFKKTLTLPAVIGAAAVDSINPCEFAVLVLLLSTILLNGNRRKALLAGFAFTLAVYISYFLMGLGLYSAMQISGLTHVIFITVSILAVLVGLFNLKDYFWYGKYFKMEVPDSWKPRLQFMIKHVTSIYGAFIVGFAVSLFLLPCTSGPYIVILGLLSEVATRNYAIMLLLLYNLIFIAPMLLITLLVYFGITTTEKAEQWRQRNLRNLHLWTGLVILLLGIGMIFSLIMGWI